MKKSGHIKLEDNKVIFVYHELIDPESLEFFHDRNKRIQKFMLEEYEASKREVEVGNKFVLSEVKPNAICIDIENSWTLKHLLNNQFCEAEVIDNNAKILKLL